MDEELHMIKNILKGERFNVKETVDLDTDIKNLSGWDSLQYLTFLLEIEKTFNLEITPEEIREIRKVQDLLRIIGQNKR